MRWMYSSDLCSLEMVLASWWSFFGESLYFSLLFSFLTWPSLWPLCAESLPHEGFVGRDGPRGSCRPLLLLRGLLQGRRNGQRSQTMWEELGGLLKLCSVRETSTKRDLFLLTAFFNCEWPLKALPQNTVALEQRKLFCCTQFKVEKKTATLFTRQIMRPTSTLPPGC